MNGLRSPDYRDNQYLYERRLHEAKREVSAALWAMKAEASVSRALAIEAVVLELIQLRYRVQDWALFEMCELELQGLQTVLSACFQQLTQFTCDEGHLQWLDAQITQFEAITETVLSISAPDPQPFALFIFALKQLRLALSDAQGVE